MYHLKNLVKWWRVGRGSWLVTGGGCYLLSNSSAKAYPHFPRFFFFLQTVFGSSPGLENNVSMFFFHKLETVFDWIHLLFYCSCWASLSLLELCIRFLAKMAAKLPNIAKKERQCCLAFAAFKRHDRVKKKPKDIYVYISLAVLLSSATQQYSRLWPWKCAEKTVFFFVAFQVQCFISKAVWNMCARTQEGKLFLPFYYILPLKRIVSHSHLSERKQTGFLKLQIRFS